MKGLRKGCVWEVSWRRNRDCNILTSISSDYSSTSSSFYWAAQPGSWGPKPPLQRWHSLRQLISNKDWNSLSRTELCLPQTPTNWHPLNQTVCGTGLYNSLTASCFLWASHLHRSRLYLDVFDRMHLFLDWRLRRRSICYTIIHHSGYVLQTISCVQTKLL